MAAHFYVALADPEQKLPTLLELLTALQLQAGAQNLSAVVVCSARDTLDSVVCALQDNPQFVVCALHSDLTDAQRQFQVARFQRLLASQATHGVDGAGGDAAGATELASPGGGGGGGGSGAAQQQPAASLVLVSTDACVKAMARDGSPALGAALLIQFELPARREHLQRRIAAAFGAPRRSGGGPALAPAARGAPSIVISFAVAGELPAFRALEKMALPVPILEMPVHVGDMFAGSGGGGVR